MTDEWNAADYHQVSTPQAAWGRRVLARLDLAGTETVVDAGCGTGRLTRDLIGRLPGGRVICLDRSGNMLRAARDHLASERGARVHFVRCDLPRIPLAACADVVFSTATFHWVLDHPALFRAIHEALVPGGRLVAQCGGAGNLDRIHQHAAGIMREARFERFFRNWTAPWEFADAAVTASRLAAAGFVDVETGLEPAPTPFDDEAALGAFLTTVVLRPHLARLPDPALQNAFVGRVVESSAADTPALTLDYVRLNLAGRRRS